MRRYENEKEPFTEVFLSKYGNRGSAISRMTSILGKEPEWSDISDGFLRKYKDSVLNDVCASTAFTYFNELKSVLNEYNGEYDFPSRKYKDILKCKKEPSQQVFLTDDEINRIYMYFPRTEYERYVRDAFLLSCYTGQRHSDAKNMDVKNIHDGILTYVSIKTKILTRLPIHDHLLEVLYDMPDVDMPDVTFNRILRNICRILGFNDELKVFQKGKEMVRKKWELVASHTARRSFCTNLYLRGADILSISKMAGHSSIDMTRRYIVGFKEEDPDVLSFFKSKENNNLKIII